MQNFGLNKGKTFILKLKASPAGGARIMRTVIAHLTRYGPNGVPKGRVDAQKGGKGRTPCLQITVRIPISLEKIVGVKIPSTLTNDA